MGVVATNLSTRVKTVWSTAPPTVWCHHSQNGVSVIPYADMASKTGPPRYTMFENRPRNSYSMQHHKFVTWCEARRTVVKDRSPSRLFRKKCFMRNWAYIKYGSWWQFFVILQVLRLASVGGRPCPGPSVQYDICNYPCDNFYWTVSAWSQCSLFEQKSSPVGKCGRGRKTRTIRLVLIHHCRNRGFFFHSPKLR